MSRLCAECGGSIEKLETVGPFVYKNFVDVYLKDPITLKTCNQCGEHFLSGNDCRDLDKKIVETLKDKGLI